mgnify:CR=1 FL=1
MRATKTVQKILSHYEGETPGVKANLCRMLMEGKLGGTGKMIILPVDQGFEHGPARSFAPNPAGYDPHYHYQLAIDAGLTAYAAPLANLEAGADTLAGQIPTILKMNHANSLMSNTAGGATWVSFHHGGGVGIGYSQHAGMVILADGTKRADRCLSRVLHNDPAMGIFRHADAGYEIAKETAKQHGLDLYSRLHGE